MATFWDAVFKVGDEIMRALDDLIEESEERFEGDDTNGAAAASAATGGTTSSSSVTEVGGSSDEVGPHTPLRDAEHDGHSPSPSAAQRRLSARRADGALSSVGASARESYESMGELASPTAPVAGSAPSSSSHGAAGVHPPRGGRTAATRVPRIRLSAMEHLRIQRFVDSALLQIAIVRLPSANAVDEVETYYRGCAELAATCSSATSLSHLLVRCEDGTSLSEEEVGFNDALVKALPTLFLQLNWVHPGAERVARIRAGVEVLVPWSVVYPLPRILHPAARPMSAAALRRWSVWIGHQLLSEVSRRSHVTYAVGLPMDAPVAPPHPNHQSVGACVSPTHWQLLLRGCAGASTSAMSLDDVTLLFDSTAAPDKRSDAAFSLRINGCPGPCLIIVRTSMLDVVGAIIPELPPKDERVLAPTAKSGALQYFTFTPTFRNFAVDRTHSSSNFFVVSHDGDGTIGVFAKCQQHRASGGGAGASEPPSSCEPSPAPSEAVLVGGGGGGGGGSGADGDPSGSDAVVDDANTDFGVAFSLDCDFKRLRLATVGNPNLPAPFAFNVATVDERTDVNEVFIFRLDGRAQRRSGIGGGSAAPAAAASPPSKATGAKGRIGHSSSADDFVIVERDDARIDYFATPASPTRRRPTAGSPAPGGVTRLSPGGKHSRKKSNGDDDEYILL